MSNKWTVWRGAGVGGGRQRVGLGRCYRKALGYVPGRPDGGFALYTGQGLDFDLGT